MATDEDTVNVLFKTIKVPGPARGGSYGLSFRGSCPVMLADVDPGSPADKAGLMKGDFLVQLNGNDIQRSSEEAVRTIIKYSQGSKLNVRIARPHPFPSTDYLRRRAIITLQTKLAAGVADTKDDVTNYKQTVQSAFLEVQDILGSLGLGDDDDLHGNNQSVQEVKVSYQGDGNSLESPPDSEKDPFEVLDPLLDFGLDDDLTINKGSGGGASTGADLVKSTIEVQRALKGIKQLTDGINAAKEQKRLENERGKITTEATFTANFQSSSTTNRRTPQQPSASPYTAPNGNSSRPLKESNIPPTSRVAPTAMNGVRERAVQEQSSVLHSERKSNGYKHERNNGRGVVAPPTFREQQEEDEDEDFSYLKQRRSSPPQPALDQPAKVEMRKKKKEAIKQTFSVPPPPVAPYQPREKVIQSSPSSSTSYSRRNEDQAPPPAIPPYNPAGPEEFLLSNKPEYKEEWKQMTNTYESVPEREAVSHPPPTDEAAYETVRERGAAPLPTRAVNQTSFKERGWDAPQLRITNETSLERSTSPPPPVPVRQHHSLSKTVSEPPPSQKSPTMSNKDKYKDISLADVPLRSKKKGANQVAAAPQEPTPVGHIEQRGSGRKMKYDLSSVASSLPAPVTDVSDVLTACAGLPSNVYQWKKDDVGVWLKQMSPTLHTHYSSLFAKHDVTGRTLLRLNATKLQSLGVNTPSHCRILATEIMRVRIHQEANELRAFKR